MAREGTQKKGPKKKRGMPEEDKEKTSKTELQ
jgi:hypothetical protein